MNRNLSLFAVMAAFWTIAAAVVLTGCIGDETARARDNGPTARSIEVGMPCDARDEPACPRYLTCRTFDRESVNGTCELADCYRDDECGARDEELVCRELTCVPKSWLAGEGWTCETDDDCPPYLACTEGVYRNVCQRPECWRTRDCADGLVCSEWQCVVPSCGR